MLVNNDSLMERIIIKDLNCPKCNQGMLRVFDMPSSTTLDTSCDKCYENFWVQIDSKHVEFEDLELPVGNTLVFVKVIVIGWSQTEGEIVSTVRKEG